MTSKLSIRLALLLLFASLTPLIAAAVLSFELMRDSLHGEAERRHGEVAQLVGSFVDVWLDSTSDKLQALGEVLRLDLEERSVEPKDGISNMDLANLQNVLQPLLVTNERWSKQAVPALELEAYSNVGVSERATVLQEVGPQNNGWMQTSASVQAKAQMQSRKGGRGSSDLVLQPQQTGFPFCEPNIELVDGIPTLAMSVAVGEVDRNYGTLVAEVDFTDLRLILDQLATEGMAIRVADDRDTALYTYGELEGEVLETKVVLGRKGWTVAVAEQLTEVEKPLGALRSQTMAWVAFAAVLALLLSIGISIGITRPVRALQRTAESMGRGELTARSGLKRNDEIGQLAAAFDQMAGALAVLDAAKSDFVGNVSHELRTPLTSMRLSVANLLDGVVGELEPKQRRTLDRVQGELDRMIFLVAELLELTRIEAGAVEPEPRSVDLTVLAKAGLEGIGPCAKQKGVSMGIEGEGWAMVDPTLLQRALGNLLDNALKFTSEGGRILVIVAPGRLVVQDTGPGFSDAELEAGSLFQKFQQGERDGAKNDGVGLGLAIVARLVQLVGGSVSAANRPAPKVGAVLTIELPKDEAHS